jgi:hypothetical protein
VGTAKYQLVKSADVSPTGQIGWRKLLMSKLAMRLPRLRAPSVFKWPIKVYRTSLSELFERNRPW